MPMIVIIIKFSSLTQTFALQSLALQPLQLIPIQKERVKVLIKIENSNLKMPTIWCTLRPSVGLCLSVSRNVQWSILIKNWNDTRKRLRLRLLLLQLLLADALLLSLSSLPFSSSTLKVSFKLINSLLAVCARVCDCQRERQWGWQASKQHSLMHSLQHQTIYKGYICLQACNSLD